MLDAGSPIPWLMRTVLLYVSIVVLLALAVVSTQSIFTTFGSNTAQLWTVYFLTVYLLFPSFVSQCHTILHTEFTVSGSDFCGVDLWLVERVWCGPHCIYLDKVCICDVPNPQVLLASLDDYYFNLTGVHLP